MCLNEPPNIIVTNSVSILRNGLFLSPKETQNFIKSYVTFASRLIRHDISLKKERQTKRFLYASTQYLHQTRPRQFTSISPETSVTVIVVQRCRIGHLHGGRVSK